MSVEKLPSGRYRARVYVPGEGNRTVGSFDKQKEAREAEADERRRLVGQDKTTLKDFWARWTTDPLFARPKRSTNIHNMERTKGFVDKHANLRISEVGDREVAAWLANGQNLGTVPALRAMFNDARSAKGGRVTDRNPFAGLGISKGRGRRDQSPPSEEKVWEIIRAARKHTTPFFAAWLQVACFTGMRPGELDALRWENVDLENNRISVAEQVSAKGGFSLPKNGRKREALITPQAREALLSIPRMRFVFVNNKGSHYTPGARAYHWNATRAASGWTDSLYLATRHFFGFYAVNILELDSEDVALLLGHEDGGSLVRVLYGHKDRDRAFERAARAFDQRGNVRPLRVVEDAS